MLKRFVKPICATNPFKQLAVLALGSVWQPHENIYIPKRRLRLICQMVRRCA